jgi:AbiV family abortive infection protein
VRRNGALTQDEVAGAMTAYFHNAQAFFDEVLLFHRSARTPRACALCVLGLEELAKIPILFATFMRFESGADRETWTRYWKGGGSHKTKQEMIIAYGQIIRSKFEQEPMLSRYLYRHYVPDTLFAHLDSFKQSNLYVDIRENGLHAPHSDPHLSSALDLLLTFGQERADSFRSWHITPTRSRDHLDVALGLKAAGSWTSSHTPQEVKADILYQASALSASVVPQYLQFRDFISSYSRTPSKGRLEQALLDLARDVRGRLTGTTDLPLYNARSIGLLKILLGLTDPDTILASSFSRKLRKALLEKV